ncbi:MAG: polyhydroxyalkanoic acid system family protein [Pseudomonadota bacterium]
MSEKITVNVPHKLGKDAARSRIDSGFAKVQQQVAGNAVEIQQSWSDGGVGDRLDFTVGLMGQSLKGRLDVADNHVHVEVDLPWLLAKLAGPIREKLTKGTQVLLEKK